MDPVLINNAMPQEMIGTQFSFAGFWKRFAAEIVDGLILIIPNFILTVGMGIITTASHMNKTQGEVLMYIVYSILNWLYSACMESSQKQGTYGKMALGIKVTDTKGNKISFARATGRYFAKILGGVIGFFSVGIGLIIWYGMAGWTKKKQAGHDMIAGTYVINR